MKILLFTFLIFSISFSGFSTVAHDFDSQTHDKTMYVNMDCADHASLGVPQDGTDQDHSKNKPDNHGCCASHCCVMKVMDIVDYSSPYYPIKESMLLVYESVHASNFLFGTFRPPRLTV